MTKSLFIFVILILLGVSSQGQVSGYANHLTTSATTSDATSYLIGNSTYTKGYLYIASVYVTGASTDGTLTGTGLNWMKIGSVGDATARIILYRAVPTANTTTTGTFASFGSTGTGFFARIVRFNIPLFTRNGATSIRQVATGTGTGTVASVTFANSMLSGKNYCLAYFMNAANPFGGTPESPWIELGDLGYATPTTGLTALRLANASDTSPSTTMAASGDWIGIAVELYPPPRLMVIN